jgi:quinol monooxygenase YgiN
MDGKISWHVELSIKPGQVENFRVLTGEMVDSAQHEIGVLSYQRFVSEDGMSVHIYERYEDSAAALAHLRVFAETFAERFRGMADRQIFSVFGYPTIELKAALDGFGAIYLTPFGDFAYW